MLYMLLAQGFEETEAVAPLDVLRRAGIDVQTVSLDSLAVTGAHGITITADITMDQLQPENCQGVVLPGGMPGTLNLQNDCRVTELLKHCYEQGKLLAAICAAPMVLGELGFLAGRSATCFPGYEEHLQGAVLSDDPVVTDGNMITARGAGTALAFGAALTDYLVPNSGEGMASKGHRILTQMQVR